MKVTVKTLKKECFDVEVSGNSVGDLRSAISTTKGLADNIDVKIIFSGKILKEDSALLSDVGINEDNFVIILTKKVTNYNKPSDPSAPILAAPTAPTSPAPTVPAPASIAETPLVTPSVPLSNPINLFGGSEQVPPAPQTLPIGSEGMSNVAQFLQQNPQMFLQILLQNPEIQQIAQQNPAALTQLLSNPNFINDMMQLAQGMDGIPGMDENVVPIQLNEEQHNEVQQLTNLGVDMQTALYYYQSCGGDVNMAANLIMEDIAAGAHYGIEQEDTIEESTEPTEQNEPVESAELTEQNEPVESVEPTKPTESIESVEPTDNE